MFAPSAGWTAAGRAAAGWTAGGWAAGGMGTIDAGDPSDLSRDEETEMRRIPFRAAAVAALLALAAALLPGAAAATATAGTDRESGEYVEYVALGDSYTAGPLVPFQIPEAGGCLRSDHNSPHLAAAALSPATFRDASCSGAQTEDMAQPQDVFPAPNPPQFDRLTADTTLVTLQIGGNDIGFSEIVENCGSATPTGSPCQDRYVVGGEDEISRRIRATAPAVAAVLREIHERAPRAAVYVLGYPSILPDSGTGCWPQMPIAWADVPYLRAKQKELNAMLRKQARAGRATYVDVYTPSIGRDACQLPGVRWVEPVVPVEPAAPVHPNARGMEGMTTAFLAVLSSS